MMTSQHMGGHGGGPFEFVQPNLCLVGIRGKAGASIDQLQFLFIDINSGRHVESPPFGGNGGNHFCWQAPEGEWIDEIKMEWNEFCQSIEAKSNGGSRSRRFGGRGHHRGHFDVQGRRITGVSGKAGALVDGITFHACQ